MSDRELLTLSTSRIGATTAVTRRPDETRIPVRLIWAGDNRAVIRPWETLDLQQILPLYPDVDAAMAGLGR